MSLLIISFLAGALTVLAPCILPVLPIIIGGSVSGTRRRNPLTITTSLAVAVVVFTLILKFSTAFINVPESFWRALSGLLIIIFGLISLFPHTWEKIASRFNLQGSVGSELQKAGTKNGFWGDVLVGLALGPVFSSCSPTYFVILASVLPASFALGTLYLIAYALGLAVVLLAIAIVGQKLVAKISWLANPNGLFKRGLGLLFILVGIFIITSLDRRIQTYIIDKGYYSAGDLEQKLLESQNMPPTAPTTSTNVVPTAKNYPRYREIVNSAGYINATPFKIADLVGKKVILVDFMTYSCINCIRTFPYLNAWYDKYKADGLEIVGIHTPEFAFEHNYNNVKKALDGYGIKFPISLDNDYSTWRNYQNNYWPRKYLIDIDGYIVYDHIGEGKYDVTELKIQELLQERMARLGEKKVVASSITTIANADTPKANSPETYFGAARNEYLGNGLQKYVGQQTFQKPATLYKNELYLVGSWNLNEESATNLSANASILYHYSAEDVFLVASSPVRVKAEVTRNGAPLTKETAGTDIVFENGKSYVYIQFDKLYHLIKESNGVSRNTIEIILPAPGVSAFAFTFG